MTNQSHYEANGLVSNYTVVQFKPYAAQYNKSKTDNLFSNHPKRNVVVSDLTYVRVGKSWHYICVLIDLFNREIIGHSTGSNKDGGLVTVSFNLEDIQIFHTDRGNEFKNQLIDKTLETFHIKHSLSMKGCPYDNPESPNHPNELPNAFCERTRGKTLF